MLLSFQLLIVKKKSYENQHITDYFDVLALDCEPFCMCPKYALVLKCGRNSAFQ